MKTFQIVVVDDTGSTTFTKRALDMIDAIRRVEGELKTRHISSITTITCTTTASI